MATDLYSDNSRGTPTSPRISFSYDLSQSDTVPVEQLLRSCSSSSIDFNFSVHEISDLHHASTADELFSDGKILPTPMKSTGKPTSSPSPENEELKQQNWKSFWGFKRSSSCGNGYGRSLCPITLLYRSYSTGSSTGSKQSSSSPKEGFDRKYRQHFQKPLVSQRPPLRKSGYGYGNHTSYVNRVNPILNLGFGSLFTGNSKNKNKK